MKTPNCSRYLLDVQQTTDSSDYFPFEDHLRSVMLIFSRDQWIATNSAINIHGKVEAKGNSSSSRPDGCTMVPPSGVLPFSGLVMYAAPLCYLYNDPVHVYYTFRDIGVS